MLTFKGRIYRDGSGDDSDGNIFMLNGQHGNPGIPWEEVQLVANYLKVKYPSAPPHYLDFRGVYILEGSSLETFEAFPRRMLPVKLISKFVLL